MKKFVIIAMIACMLSLVGCNNAVESQTDTKEIDIGIDEAATFDEEISATEEAVDVSYLSSEQLVEYKKNVLKTFVSTFRTCIEQDSEALNDTEFFDLQVEICKAPEYEDNFYTASFSNELLYHGVKDNKRECWHAFTVDTEYLTTDEYVEACKSTLAEYDVKWANTEQYQFCKNVFAVTEQYIMLTSTPGTVWIGMTDTKNLNSSVLSTFKK